MSSAFLRRVAGRFFLVLCGCCLLAASAGSANAAGIFTTAYLGGGSVNWDSSIGLSTSKTYLEAVNLAGGSGTLGINGVAFTDTAAGTANPSGTGWSLAGNTSEYTSGLTPLVGGNLQTLLKTFVYGGNPEVTTLTGLTPGQTYVITYYSCSFDAAGNRVQNLTTSDGASTAYDVDTGAPGQGYANLLRYTFVANSSGTESISGTPQVTASTWHTYGFATEQTFNTVWAGSGNTNWSALATSSAWTSPSNSVPGGADTNASFPAQTAPTTITLDTNTTLGYLQFAGSNSYTLQGTNTLTLQSDIGGTALLNSMSGAHSINTPIALNSSAAALGSGTLTLGGAISGTGGLSVGGGLLQLTMTNTFTGGFTAVNGGLVDLLNANAIQNSTVTMSGGTVAFDSSVSPKRLHLRRPGGDHQPDP